MSPYSTTKEFEELGDFVDFRTIQFDTGSGGWLKYLGFDIDGIAVKDNIVCLVDMGKTLKKSEAEDKIKKCGISLRDFNHLDSLRGCVIDPADPVKQERLTKLTQTLATLERTHPLIFKKVCLFPNVEFSEDEVRKFKEKHDIHVVDQAVFEYLKLTHATLGRDYTYREFLYFLYVHKIDLEPKSVSRAKIPKQDAPHDVIRVPLSDGKVMYSTAYTVRELIERATVLRVAQKYNKKGFQRMVDDDRISTMAEQYLQMNETFPNNIIIALNPRFYKDEASFFTEKHGLALYDEFNSLFIVDGQHRFFSFLKAGKLDATIIVNFIFIEGDDEYGVIDRMFYDINTGQKQLDPRLKFFLLSRLQPQSPESFWFEVFKKLNDTKGLFFERISFKESLLRKKKDTKEDLFSVIKYGGVLTLNQTVKKVKGLDMVYSKSTKNERVREAHALLANLFLIIQKLILKQRPGRPALLSARSTGALIRLLRHFLHSAPQEVKKLARMNIRTLSRNGYIQGTTPVANRTIKFFESILGKIDFEELETLDLSSSNWAAVEGFILKKIHTKGRTRFGSRDLLSKKGQDLYDAP